MNIFCRGCGTCIRLSCKHWECIVNRLAIHQKAKHDGENQNYIDLDFHANELEEAYEKM